MFAYDPAVADIDIPQSLIDAQRAADEAFAAIRAHRQAVGKPALEWSDEENARNRELWAATQQAAEALRAAIQESGLETEHGSYTFNRALRAAVKEHAEAGR